MPRDVVIGEGYDGDVQVSRYAPGHHNGEFWLDDGSSTLMQMGDIPSQGYDGMGNLGLFEWLLGKGQDWFNMVSKLQNDLIAASAGITAVGQPVWDQIWSQMQGKVIPGTSYDFWGYGFAFDIYNKTFQTLLVTDSHAPSDSELSAANALLARIRASVDYAKNVLPGIAAKVAAEVSSMQQKVDAIPPMRSPADVGVETFKKEITQRVESIGERIGKAIDLTPYLLGGGVLVAAAIFLPRLLGK